MLEFYLAPTALPTSIARLKPIFFADVLVRGSTLLAALLLAACATTGADDGPGGGAQPARPSAPPLPRTAEPPPPPVNLSGFPLPYRQGYADGCASATGPERKDGARYGSDGNYRTGWIDGLALCKRK